MCENEKPVAIVTGAASGIGKATALRFAESGYRIFMFDIDAEKLNAVVRSGLDHLPICGFSGDVSLSVDVEKGLEKCLSEYGRVDVLVSNVGILDKASFLELQEDQWDRVLSVNLKGMFLFGQAVSRWMVRNSVAGSIVNIACMRAQLVSSNMAAYAASKGGVVALTKAMALELAAHGIRVNAIQPGRTLTEGGQRLFSDPEVLKRLEGGVPMRRLANPCDIADVALFLASEGARYITGAVIPVDGGYTAGKD